MAIAGITMIREIFNCQLPIEVFFMGEEDLSIENQEIMEALPSVRTVNIDHIFDTEHLYIWGWSVKSFALLASSFENAMLIGNFYNKLPLIRRCGHCILAITHKLFFKSTLSGAWSSFFQG